jgi:ankyrin repeat protein
MTSLYLNSLHNAIIRSDNEDIKRLLQAHHPSELYYTNTFDVAILQENVDAIDMLIEYLGLTKDNINDYSMDPINFAIRNQRKKSYKWMIRYFGASVDDLETAIISAQDNPSNDLLNLIINNPCISTYSTSILKYPSMMGYHKMISFLKAHNKYRHNSSELKDIIPVVKTPYTKQVLLHK